jgi:hypothetical protein
MPVLHGGCTNLVNISGGVRSPGAEINSLNFGNELATNTSEWKSCKAQGAKVVPL